MVLVANKTDMPDRCVSYDEGQALADKYGIPFFETSAKENQNVSDAFHKIAELIVQRMNENPNAGGTSGGSGNGNNANAKQSPNERASPNQQGTGNARLSA
mmetsp:Transcript_18327/g.25771  ORF Transcript_18327/g.25771 Transcript_18327/m.25771 type:complete len:101 (-) Transcript_18327:326-628(-)